MVTRRSGHAKPCRHREYYSSERRTSCNLWNYRCQWCYLGYYQKRKKNTPTKITIESSLGFQESSRQLPVLNAREYGILLNEAFTNDGRFPPVPNVSTLDEGTDWQNEIFENATIQRNVLTLTGGSETINYSFGASTLRQDGIVGKEKSGFKRNA